MANRKEAEKFIIDNIGEITKSENNKEIYRQIFSKMSDLEFKAYMQSIKDGKTSLTVFVPNSSKEASLDTARNIKLANKLGIKLFGKVKITDSDVRPDHITKLEYLVLRLPFKRTAQLLSKKISVPEHSNTTNVLTGQVTGDSKGGTMTLPELQITSAIGLNDSLVELMKNRGGDAGALNAMNAMLETYGHVSQEAITPFSTGVVSKHTLKAYLNSAHLENNL